MPDIIFAQINDLAHPGQPVEVGYHADADHQSHRRWADAIDYFKRAESLVHATPHLLYIARAQAQTGLFVEARENYLTIIHEELKADAPQVFKSAKESASKEIRDVESHFAYATVTLKATLAGTVVEQRISISGAGEVRGDKLWSQSATVDVSGAGSIVVNVAKTLRASISGAGSVEYYGDPEVKQSVSGIGRVKRRASAAAAERVFASTETYWTVAPYAGASASASALKSRRDPVDGSRSG